MADDHPDDLISAFIDGELNEIQQRKVTAHMAGCADCAALADQILQQRRQISAVSQSPLPEGLAARVKAALREEAAKRVTDKLPKMSKPARSSNWKQIAAVAALLLATATVSSFTTLFYSQRSNASALVQRDLITAHLRSLAQNGAIQVASSDQHTVKPWFAGKVDFSPEARDFTTDGFPLVGGRLDIIDGKRVSALVYKRRLHQIDVFAWADSSLGEAVPTLQTARGYNLVSWSRSGVSYRAVSDLEKDELQRFAELM